MGFSLKKVKVYYISVSSGDQCSKNFKTSTAECGEEETQWDGEVLSFVCVGCRCKRMSKWAPRSWGCWEMMSRKQHRTRAQREGKKRSRGSHR